MKQLTTLLFFTSLLIICFNASAQQDFNLSHYSFNKLLINPAVAGGNGGYCFSSISKIEWANMKDETFLYPTGIKEDEKTELIGQETFAGTFSAPLIKSEKYNNHTYLGIGLSASADNAAYINTNNIKLALAGRIPLNRGTSSIGIGVDIGILEIGLDGKKLRAKHPNDPRIPNNKVANKKANTSLGIYYTNSNLNNFYIGLSTTRLNEPQFTYGKQSLISINTQRHHYLMAGFVIPKIIKNIDIKPSILLKYNAKLQADLTAIAQYKNKFYLGAGYRTLSAAGYLMVGIQAKKHLRIGYSTDFSATDINSAGLLTHEVQINYCIFTTKFSNSINVRTGNELPSSD